jgi:YidC/Oxa1 family membrane protein insertase
LPYDVPQFLVLGAWPLMMGLTMYLQQKLAPASPDPVQAAMFKWMPFIFTIMLAHFPAGLVIYWTWSNLLAISQQYYLLKRHA